MGGPWYQEYDRAMTAAERQRKYKRDHPNKIKAAIARRDPKKMADRAAELIQLDPRPYLLRTARRRAKERDREFTITVDDIVIPETCPYFPHIKLVVLNTRVPGHDSMTLDRIDNSKGYIPGNIEVISYRANSLKKDATVAELKAIVERLEKLSKVTF